VAIVSDVAEPLPPPAGVPVLARMPRDDETDKRYLLAARHAPIGIAIAAPDGVFLDVNDKLCRLLGYSRRDLVGKSFRDITHPDDVAVDLAHVQELLDGRAETYRIEKRYLTAEGRVLWVQVTVALARDDQDDPLYFIGMIEDISAQREARTALAHRATHDSLTGLANRTLLLDRTQVALAQQERDGRPVALLFCDLDQFKLINDSRGHDAGDAVLVETAERLVANIRAGDTAARLGGDEFVVLCTQLSSTVEAERVAQRLIDMLIQPMVRASGLTMTVSIGIAFASPGISAADLLRNADAAMYKAKASGRDRCALFTPDLIEQATERLDMEHELREAIRSQALYLDYQPVMRLADGKVVGYECLVRWRHPERGLLPPGAFLPFAESSDLILEIDRWVLANGCAAAAAWGDGPDAPDLTVNVSARHVGRGLLPGLIARVLRESGLPANRLMLEITETALLGMTPTAQSELDTMVHLGVRLAIDDFGTGYSSLANLVDVPASYVKIDRAFVSEMTRAASPRAIVGAVISLCEALGIAVVAEGIEDQAQLDLLGSMGCAFGQGYLLGRPGPNPV
jgi:diguanylate cyclase (GGDEF)-like protein/PAS domain S-box-containing protein